MLPQSSFLKQTEQSQRIRKKSTGIYITPDFISVYLVESLINCNSMKEQSLKLLEFKTLDKAGLDDFQTSFLTKIFYFKWKVNYHKHYSAEICEDIISVLKHSQTEHDIGPLLQWHSPYKGASRTAWVQGLHKLRKLYYKWLNIWNSKI